MALKQPNNIKKRSFKREKRGDFTAAIKYNNNNIQRPKRNNNKN